MRKALIFLLGFYIIIGIPVSKPEAYEFRRIGEDYRALAMGNTGIASANNSAALFYNPAAMANIFDGWVDYLPFQISMSDDAVEMIDLMSSGINLDNQSEIFSFLEEQVGRHAYVRIHGISLNAFFNIDKRGTTVGANYSSEHIFDLEIRNASSFQTTFFERFDLVRQVGFSYPIGLGKWVVGLTYKNIQRAERSFEYNIFDAMNGTDFPDLEIKLDSISGSGSKGSGSGLDVGFLYRSSSKARLMIGGVWRTKIDLGDATTIPSQFDLGLAMRHDLGLFRWVVALDLRDVTRQMGSGEDANSKTSIYRRLHFGSEIGVFPINKTSSIFNFRVGYNQGHYTYGAEFAFSHYFILGYTKYTEETGEWAGQKPNPRSILYLSFGF